MIDRTAVIAALDAIVDPKSGQGLVAAGLVQGLTVAEDRAGFVLEAPAGETAIYAPVRDAAELVASRRQAITGARQLAEAAA